MIHSNDFQPDWISPPGDTIVDILDEMGLSAEELSRKMGISSKKGQKLLDGDLPIGLPLASKLEIVLKVSSVFWLKRDSQYQAYKRELEEKEQRWLELLPISDMVKFGWIPKRSPRPQRVKDCLRFFSQDSIESWFQSFDSNSISVAYRTSNTLAAEPAAVYTWLNFAKVISERTKCLPFDKEELRDIISEIRALTNEPNPQVFIPKLKAMLAEAGVVFVIAKSPAGCRASGATCFFEKNKATLVMSFRYLTDDHFWFTLFHEIGHLLLHSDNQQTHVEERGTTGLSSKEEVEANNFAINILIPKPFQDEMKGFYKKDWKKIVRFSRKVGVSRGIVLGQLQYMGNIDYSYLNRLKVRYKW
jgi:HTH-type transcriptional regulator / antitoxin HigA